MTTRRMTLDDLKMVLDWAAAEGWNPGLDDAEAFYAADPDGFLLNEIDGQPVAAVSVVNHSESFAFLGLYIAAPDWRGQGHGIAVWDAGIAHAGARRIGLDGVPDQQANYAKSGFESSGKTTRYHGTLPKAEKPLARLATTADLDHLCAADKRASGADRPRFARAWFTNTATRKTVLLPGGDYATFRACREGVKIGPLVAQDAQAALALLSSLPEGLPTGSLYIDLPDTSSGLAELLIDRGFAPSFETARMYRPALTTRAQTPFYATATLELG